jgi:hypothetical protein
MVTSWFNNRAARFDSRWRTQRHAETGGFSAFPSFVDGAGNVSVQGQIQERRHCTFVCKVIDHELSRIFDGVYVSPVEFYRDLPLPEGVRDFKRIDQRSHRVGTDHEVPLDELTGPVGPPLLLRLRVQSVSDLIKLILPRD